MYPIDDTNLPRQPDISVEHLRSLLLDLPREWRLFADDSVRFLLVDGDRIPRGYIDVAQARLVLLDGVTDTNIDNEHQSV